MFGEVSVVFDNGESKKKGRWWPRGPDGCHSQALGALKTGLEQASATVRTLLGDAKGVLTVTDDQLRAAIVGADMAVVGMGHPENVAGEEFRAAMMCRELGVPYWMYADNPVFTGGVLRRPWFANALSAAAGVFVPKATDADDAKQCMPLLRVIAAGNPTHDRSGSRARRRSSTKFRITSASCSCRSRTR